MGVQTLRLIKSSYCHKGAQNSKIQNEEKEENLQL